MKPVPMTTFQLAILDGPTLSESAFDNIVSIEWLSCKHTGESLFEFYRGDSLISSVNLEDARWDLSNLLGIIVVGSANKFEAIVSTWNSRLPSISITFKRIAEWERNAILCASLDCLAENLVSHRLHSVQAALDLAAHRREFDRLQRAFSRLEEYASRQSFQPTTEVFEYPPDSAMAPGHNGGLEVGDGSGRMHGPWVQYLPVDSCGVSGLSIYITAKPEPPAEPLQIRLRAIETGQIFGAWAIHAGEAPVGWVELALTYAIAEPALSLEVIIECPRETSGWSLATGPAHPYKEFAARTGAGGLLGAPLALRVFGGLPGVRVPISTTAIMPVNASTTLSKFIPYDTYGTVEQILPGLDDNAPLLVSYDSNIRCITVHPHKGGSMTVARINVAVPKRAWRVSAQIHLAHEGANRTQFGLMICPPRESNRAVERVKHLDGATAAFSGWKSLAPLEKKSLAALIEPSAEERLWIYLLTRQAPESSPDFAWARFDKFEFNLLPALPTIETASQLVSSFRQQTSASLS